MAKGRIQDLLEKGQLGQMGHKGNLKIATEVFEFDRTNGRAITAGEEFNSEVLKVPGNSVLLGIRVIRDFSIGLNFHRKEIDKARETKFFATIAAGATQADISGVYGTPSNTREGNIIGTYREDSILVVPRAIAAVTQANAKGNITVMLLYVNI